MNKIIHGDAKTELKKLADNSVDCCVTSPPYWGLRDYGTGTWEGGKTDCDHVAAKIKTRFDFSMNNSPIQDASRTGTDGKAYKRECPNCGALRIDNQLGLESTPDQYVENMVEVFREVKRVLKKTGTLWLNLGDSYANGGAGRNDGNHRADGRPGGMSYKATGVTNQRKLSGDLKAKDLVGIPWMVAFALRSDGWYLRQDIIWHKPNPMPESVTDRCTKAHEYIFLMSKSEKYYYDADAIATKMLESSIKRHENGWSGDEDRGYSNGKQNNLSKYIGSDVAKERTKANKKSVWTVNTRPYSEAHFATFPERLIVDCIKAGCPENGVVLDPFAGAGTTCLVARKLNRNFIGIELNEKYIKIAKKRLYKELGMFNC